jgi:RNA-binding protein
VSARRPPAKKAGKKRRKPSVKRAEEKAAAGRSLALPLTANQKRFLRGLAHQIDPVVQVGHKGLTDTVLKEIQSALGSHELIKVKLGNKAPLEAKEAALAIAAPTRAEIVQVIGGVVLLFKAAEDPSDRKVKLPAL